MTGGKHPTHFATIPDPDHQEQEFKQLTTRGIEAMAQYYSEKYSEREPISGITAFAVRDLEEGPEDIVEADQIKFDRVVSETAANAISQITRSKTPQKIMLTVGVKNTPESTEVDPASMHAMPLVLTSDKLISLRDEKEDYHQLILQQIAEALGVGLVKPRETATSIQGDHSSCMGIAAGILKDLNNNDLAQVAKFQDGYEPLAKMLKYSQSLSHIRNFPAIQDEPVKESGQSLIDYVRENKNAETQTTRIKTKLDKFKDDESWVDKSSTKPDRGGQGR